MIPTNLITGFLGVGKTTAVIDSRLESSRLQSASMSVQWLMSRREWRLHWFESGRF